MGMNTGDSCDIVVQHGYCIIGTFHGPLFYEVVHGRPRHGPRVLLPPGLFAPYKHYFEAHNRAHRKKRKGMTPLTEPIMERPIKDAKLGKLLYIHGTRYYRAAWNSPSIVPSMLGVFFGVPWVFGKGDVDSSRVTQSIYGSPV